MRHMIHLQRAVALVSVQLALAGCSDGGGSTGNTEPTAPVSAEPSSPQPTGTPQACDVPSPGQAPLRRLSNFEYQNTLEDLTGDPALAARISQSLVREPTSLGFRNSASALTIPPLVADSYVKGALDVAH